MNHKFPDEKSMLKNPKEKLEEERRVFQKHVHPKLRFRMRLFFVLGILMSFIVLRDIIERVMSIHLALLSILVGILIGWFSSRVFRFDWDGGADKVVGKVDIVGVLVLIAYTLFEITQRIIFTKFIHVPLTAAMTFAFISFLFIGRGLGMRRRILDLLEEERVTA